MEAIFLVCGAGGPQLKRNPLGSRPTIERVPVLTDDQITAAAEAHVRTWYGDDWKPGASVPLTDPPGVFFRCQRRDGEDYTGMPTPFFVFRDTGRVINLGHVPDLTLAEIELLRENRAASLALADPTNPDHAAAIAPYIRRAIAQGPAPLFKWSS